MQGVQEFLSEQTTGHRLGSAFSVAVMVALLSAGCAQTPKGESKEAPPVPSFEAFMVDAAKAKQEGSAVKERDTYRAAAAAYPTRKEPWTKLAESYFEVSDYGNSILAAQEVLQRDAADSVATSMLAVSGLRVSTAALASLRQHQSLRSDTRAQAEEVVKTLREVLGESVLVPTTTAPSSAPRRRPPLATPTPPAPATASATAATPTAPAPPSAPAPPTNPFDKLPR